MKIRPILTTGVVLASSCALVAGTAAPAPTEPVSLTASTSAAVAPTRTLTNAQVRLLAATLFPEPLQTVTPADIIAALGGAYGPWIDELDAYYPTDEPGTPRGPIGVGYFLSDAFLTSLTDLNIPLVSQLSEFIYANITSYLFEVGPLAALHVGLAEATGGPDTPLAQVLQRIFNPDSVPVPADTLFPEPLHRVSFNDALAAFDGAYGPWIDELDAYYPNDDQEAVRGLAGLAYYLSDAVLRSLMNLNIPILTPIAEFVYSNVTTYLFEVGPFAALHVGLAELTGGPDTPFARFLASVFNNVPSSADSSVVPPDPEATPAEVAVTSVGGAEARTFAGTTTATGTAPQELPAKQPNLLAVPVTNTTDETTPPGPDPQPAPEPEPKTVPKADLEKDAEEEPLDEVTETAPATTDEDDPEPGGLNADTHVDGNEPDNQVDGDSEPSSTGDSGNADSTPES